MVDATQPNPREDFTQDQHPVHSGRPAPQVNRIRPPRRDQPQRRARRYTPKAMIIGLVAGLSVFVLLAVLMTVGAYAYFQIYELILPGVVVGDVPLGGLTGEEAAARLAAEWGEGRGLLVNDGEQDWPASPHEFGLAMDPAATAQQALNIGHGGPIFAEMVAMFNSATSGERVYPVIAFDPGDARAGLEAWKPKLEEEPTDASIRIEDGEVLPVPGEQGRRLDVDASLRIIATDPGRVMLTGHLPLVFTAVAPRVIDASAAVAEAEALLAEPVIISGYDPITNDHMQWTASPETIAAWLAVETTPDGPGVVVAPDRLNDYTDQLSRALGTGRYLDPAESAGVIEAALRGGAPASVMIRHEATTYTVQSGDTLTSIAWDVGMPYWRILEANPGLDADAISTGQVLNIPSRSELLPLPVVATKRIVVDISDQRLWAYENDGLKYEYVISTGIDRSPTQPGVFQVQTHDPYAYASVWDLYMPNFIGIYEAWPGFENGFHGLPTLSGGQILWEDILGSPASYGCIILDLDDAEALYSWAEDGVVVEIVE